MLLPCVYLQNVCNGLLFLNRFPVFAGFIKAFLAFDWCSHNVAIGLPSVSVSQVLTGLGFLYFDSRKLVRYMKDLIFGIFAPNRKRGGINGMPIIRNGAF